MMMIVECDMALMKMMTTDLQVEIDTARGVVDASSGISR